MPCRAGASQAMPLSAERTPACLPRADCVVHPAAYETGVAHYRRRTRSIPQSVGLVHGIVGTAVGRQRHHLIRDKAKAPSVMQATGWSPSEGDAPSAWAFGWPVLRLRLCANGEFESPAPGSQNMQKGPCWSEIRRDPFFRETVLCSVCWPTRTPPPSVCKGKDSRCLVSERTPDRGPQPRRCGGRGSRSSR
jgi:hypothetical protein